MLNLKSMLKKLAATSLAVSSLLGNAAFPEYANANSYRPSANGSYRNVLYYGYWSGGKQNNYNPENINGSLITHLVYYSLYPDENGNIILDDPISTYGMTVDTEFVDSVNINTGVIPDMLTLREKYPNIRLGVSVGGWNRSEELADVCANDEIRQKFVDNLIQFMQLSDFDFIDVDWQYPGMAHEPTDICNCPPKLHYNKNDGKNLHALLSEIKLAQNALSAETWRVYELSATLSPSAEVHTRSANSFLPDGVDIGYDTNNIIAVSDSVTFTKEESKELLTKATEEYIHGIFDIVDFANISTYDMNGAWSKYSGHQSALYSYPDSVFEAISDEDIKTEASLYNYSVDSIVSFLLGKTEDSVGNKLLYNIETPVDPAKIIIGTAGYTRGWEDVVSTSDINIVETPGVLQKAKEIETDYGTEYGASNAKTIEEVEWKSGVFALGQIERGSATEGYNSLKDLYPNVRYYFDDTAKASYLYDPEGGAFFTFDDKLSIEAKGEYIKSIGLGGFVSWTQMYDKETDSGYNDYALTAMKEALWGESLLESFDISSPNYSHIDFSMDSGILTIVNNYQMKNESILYEIFYDDNKLLTNVNALWFAERNSKTLCYPTFTITPIEGEAKSFEFDFLYIGDEIKINLEEEMEITDASSIEKIKISTKLCIDNLTNDLDDPTLEQNTNSESYLVLSENITDIIKAPLPEFTGTGGFGIKDVVYAKKAVLGISGYYISDKDGDFTGNGTFGFDDIIYLKKALLGMDV